MSEQQQELDASLTPDVDVDIAATFGIVSPIVTGWVLVRFGPMIAFGVAALCQIVAALPLFWLQVRIMRVRAVYRFWRGLNRLPLRDARLKSWVLAR